MKKIVYPLCLLALLIVLTSSINSFENTTLVLPPNDQELVLPDQSFNYEVQIPPHIEDFLLGWGNIDISFMESIDNEKATLGRVLFYDDRLSGDNSLSCASCHQQALSFSDEVALSDGIDDNLTTRNSMPLNDLGWQAGSQFFWDFRSPNIVDAVLQPILAAHELGKNMPNLIAKLKEVEEYNPLFLAAYDDEIITESRITESLAMFLVSMTSFDSKYDKNAQNNFADFTISEMEGMNLFDNNCSFCHITPHFGTTDGFLFPNGTNGLDSVMVDLGLGGWTGDPMDNGRFKSPSLRNIEMTAPYMHDGRFNTLGEVVDFYSEGIQFNENSFFNWVFGEDFTGFDFTEEEKENLIDFMHTLTDPTLLTDVKWSNPWQTSVANNATLTTQIKVYPNPVADMVVVDLENPSGKTFNLSLYDIKGNLIKTYQTAQKLLEIPRGNSPAGVYELFISDGQSYQTYKLVYR